MIAPRFAGRPAWVVPFLSAFSNCLCGCHLLSGMKDILPNMLLLSIQKP